MIQTIVGKDINDTWFQLLIKCQKYGRVYTIDKGEFEGSKRKELDSVVAEIKMPWLRPLSCSLGQSIVPTTDQEIENYFYDYLINPSHEVPENEEYRYASWIAPRWEYCCHLLANGEGGCNQAVITLGESPGFYCGPKFSHFAQPPCLRYIQMKIIDGKLVFVIVFRSNDLVGAWGTNLGGIQLLKELCLDMINSIREEKNLTLIRDGGIIYFSSGCHIYEHYFDLIDEYIKE